MHAQELVGCVAGLLEPASQHPRRSLDERQFNELMQNKHFHYYYYYYHYESWRHIKLI